MSLVLVTVSLQREKGELKPLELQNKEEFLIREVQSEVYSAEIEPLRRNKEVLRGTTLAPFNTVLVNDVQHQTTRCRRSHIRCKMFNHTGEL